MKKCVEQENLSALMAHGGVEGLRLANENREISNVPVLMLTAKSDEEDKVSGLRLGADDYLTKPFSLNELMARVKKQIYTQVWAEEYAFDDNNIMSFISKLRKKVEPDPDHPLYILTVRGVGYRFNMEA